MKISRSRWPLCGMEISRKMDVSVHFGGAKAYKLIILFGRLSVILEFRSLEKQRTFNDDTFKARFSLVLFAYGHDIFSESCNRILNVFLGPRWPG